MVAVPDGFTVVEDEPSLPPGFSVVSQPSNKKKNFAERFGADLRHRFGEQGAEIINARVLEDQGFMSTALQLTGKVGAGTIVDFIGEVLISGGRGLAAITPPMIKDPLVKTATKAGILLLDTKLGQEGLEAAQNGIIKWQEFSEKNPVMARNIEAVVDIGLIVAPVKATPKSQGLIGRAGTAIERSGIRSVGKNKRAFVEKLVKPDQTKAVKEAQTARTTESGIFRQKKVEPTPLQKQSIDEVMKLKVSRNKSLQGNLNVIRQAVFKETDVLSSRLAKTGKRGIYNRDEYLKALDDAFLRLQKNPALVGNPEISAKRVIDIMRSEVEGQSAHVSNLLKARKSFDKKLIDEGKERLFDPNMENAITFAIREVRKTTNDFIHTRVPTVGVKRSLFKQSRLLHAADDIAVKAAKQMNNVITRHMQKLIQILRLRSEAAQTIALALGLGGLGAAAVAGPFLRQIAGTAAFFYIGTRLVMAPGARKALGRMLKLTDRATLRVSDPAVLREMRADRALIVELLKMADKEDSE